MKTVKEYKEEFDKCESDKERWEFILKYKKNILLTLDNDSTFFCIVDDGMEYVEEDDNYFGLNEYLGNGSGLDYILPLLGLNHEYC